MLIKRWRARGRKRERERGKFFKQSGRGGVFDAKLMIIRDHDCLVK